MLIDGYAQNIGAASRTDEDAVNEGLLSVRVGDTHR